MRMHASAYFWVLSDSDIALLRKGGSACISQSSAGQKTLPVMKLRWRRAGHLARAFLPFFEHIHGITISQNRTARHGVFAVVVAADFVLVSIDGEYQGPQFAKAPAKALRHLDVEIVKRSDRVSGFAVCPNAGSSSAPSLGAIAVEGSPLIAAQKF